MTRLRYVDLSGTVGSGGLTSGATSHTFTAPLTYAAGTTVPTLTGSDDFLLTILNTAGTAVSEVVRVTAYNSGTGAATIVRGQEGTTAASHTSGDKVTQSTYPGDLQIVRDLRWYAPSGHVSIDEHDDDSLDSAWVQVDRSTGAPAANIAWTEIGDSVVCELAGGDSTSNIHALLRPITAMATGDAIYTYFDTDQHLANYTMGGLLLSTTTTPASGNQLAALCYHPTANNGQFNRGESWTFSGFASASISQVAPGTDQHTAAYLRLVYLGSNTWRVDTSTNGVRWRKGSNISWAFTPTHAGYVGSSWGTSVKGLFAYDTLRRMSGVS